MPVSKIHANIQVAFFKEDGSVVAYCPALDLSAYGDSLEDAQCAFEETFDIFIDDINKKGNLIKVLLSLGWTIKTEPKPVFKSPYFKSNEDIESTMPSLPANYHFLKTQRKNVAIPVN